MVFQTTQFVFYYEFPEPFVFQVSCKLFAYYVTHAHLVLRKPQCDTKLSFFYRGLLQVMNALEHNRDFLKKRSHPLHSNSKKNRKKPSFGLQCLFRIKPQGFHYWRQNSEVLEQRPLSEGRNCRIIGSFPDSVEIQSGPQVSSQARFFRVSST